MNHQLLIPRRRAGGDWVASLLAYSPIALYAADRGVYSDAGTTPAVASDPVYQWNDQSGNSRHLIQSVLASRATLDLTAGPNSTPCLISDGVDDFMVTSANVPAFPSKRGSLYIVGRCITAADNRMICGNYDGAAVDWLLYGSPNPASAKNSWFDGSGTLTVAANDGAGNNVIKGMWRDGDTTLKHRRNGSAADSLTIFDNQPSSSPFSVFGNTSGAFLATYRLSFVALFPDLSLAQNQAIESILNTQYAVY